MGTHSVTVLPLSHKMLTSIVEALLQPPSKSTEGMSLFFAPPLKLQLQAGYMAFHPLRCHLVSEALVFQVSSPQYEWRVLGTCRPQVFDE